jgi:hypothetical protein
MKYNERVSGGITGILPRSAANNRRLPEIEQKMLKKQLVFF